MKSLILGWLFAILSVSFAFANCPAGTYFTTNETNCIFVSPTNPLPAILGAGTNIIGKIGIDQTIPGTTDLITKRYDRPIIITGNLNITGSSYTVTQNMGGMGGTLGVPGAPITLSTGLPSGTFVKIPHIQTIIAGATVSACGGTDAIIFSTNPTGTTFTDNSATTIATADIPKIATTYNTSCIIQASVGIGISAPTNFVPNAVPVDGSGNLYMAIQSAGTSTIGTPSKIYYTVELGY